MEDMGEGEKMRNAEGWIDRLNRGQGVIEGKRQERVITCIYNLISYPN